MKKKNLKTLALAKKIVAQLDVKDKQFVKGGTVNHDGSINLHICKRH